MPRSRLRALAVLTLAPLLLGGSDRARPPSRDPVLFVHGWRGDRAQWVPMLRRFREDGWADARLYSWTYNSGQSNAVTAEQLSRRIDQILVATRASRVDVVAHSMGALPTRYYLKKLRGDDKVDAWVSLAGPNHGTSAAEICFSAACREMRIGSAFLAELNAEDETPGDPRYATWWSPCDEIIDPDASVALDGAANHRTHCIYHLDFFTDPHVYRGVRDFISR
jgi:triacylglycerol lipase